MKQIKLVFVLALSTIAFSLSSCGTAEDKTTTESVTSDSTETSTPTAETTVVTTPQNLMLVWHKISGFAKWKPSYEAHDSLRLAHGVHSYVIGRGVQDSNMLMVALKVDDVAKAKAFANDPSLKEAMKKGGVTGAPKFKYTTVVYQDNAPNMSDLRSMTTFTVKDWDAWKQSFESDRQIRMDNGLTDRAYGYEMDDNRKVVLVVAINDSAKAEAFWNSEQIKELRAKSGVVGQPERFIYRVAQKY